MNLFTKSSAIPLYQPSRAATQITFSLKTFSGTLTPGSSAGKESACNAGDPGSSPGSGRSPGEGMGLPTPVFLGFPGGSAGKESACHVEALGSIPGLGRSPGDGNGYPLQ